MGEPTKHASDFLKHLLSDLEAARAYLPDVEVILGAAAKVTRVSPRVGVILTGLEVADELIRAHQQGGEATPAVEGVSAQGAV